MTIELLQSDRPGEIARFVKDLNITSAEPSIIFPWINPGGYAPHAVECQCCLVEVQLVAHSSFPFAPFVSD